MPPTALSTKTPVTAVADTELLEELDDDDAGTSELLEADEDEGVGALLLEVEDPPPEPPQPTNAKVTAIAENQCVFEDIVILRSNHRGG
jgi:hypothetical protein